MLFNIKIAPQMNTIRHMSACASGLRQNRLRLNNATRLKKSPCMCLEPNPHECNLRLRNISNTIIVD